MNFLFFKLNGDIMKAVQISIVGLKNSGKTTIAEKLKQKKEIEKEKFDLYSFKQGASLVYLTDTPYNIDEPKEMIALMKEADACLFCISAIDAINQKLGELILLLKYSNIKKGVIAITKTDSSTPDEVESLKKKIKAILAESKLKEAPIVEVSSITKEGFDELRENLVQIEPEERKGDKLKMPVECAEEEKKEHITLYGIINSGTIKKYDQIRMMPWGKEFVVQELKLHGEVVEEVESGNRVGVLLKGLYPWDVQMGDWITEEGVFEKGKKLKIELEITNFFKDKLRTGSECRLNIGMQTFPVNINKIIKDGSEINEAEPGQKVEVELESKLPFAFKKEQNCILFHPEAHWQSIRTVGSGVVKGVTE